MTISRPTDRAAVEVFGPYRVLAPLGRGGMGEVHEAYDTVRERHVALKRILAGTTDQHVRERFRRESRIAARLDSPHVIPIHDFGVIGDRLFIDMRLVRGPSLAGVIDAHGPLSPARAVAITAQLANALDSAHEAGLVHRDVKPSNAVLSQHRGHDFVYLVDFGIVHVREAGHDPRLTGTGMAIGTAPYMAPEQLRCDPIDHRVDVYALGCVLYEMLTGRTPFDGDRLTMAHQHLHAEPVPPSRRDPRVPASLDVVVLRALAKRPDDRWAGAGELADAARRALDLVTPPRPSVPVLPPVSRPTPAPPAVPDRPALNRLAVAAVVLGVILPLLGIAVGAVGLRQIRRTGERGRQAARAGIVVGAVLTCATAALFAWFLIRTPVVPAAALQAQIVAQSGLAADQVHCPTSLPARVGASVECTATAGGRSQPLRVTATVVNGDQVSFDIVTE